MMKKLIKGFIIGACVCILVGTVFFVGAACAGGISGAKSIMENGGISIGISSDDFADWDKASEHTISLEDMDEPSLDLELGAGDFEIIESDVTDIVVKSSKKIDVKKDGDTIKIHTPERLYFIKFGIGNEHNDVTIEIPKGMKFEDVDMQIGAGELRCENIVADHLKMELGAGTIDVESYSSKESVISVGAGEIIVEKGISEDMDIDVGMGSFSFHGAVNGDLDVDCGMGNVQMWLDNAETDFDYQVDCGMGNITVGNQSYGGVATDQDIDNNADYKCDLDCGMGNIEIHFEK